MSKKEGRLFIISAPSGTGKSTVINRIMELRSGLFFSVSATTRKPRSGEADGVQYHFITRDRFNEMAENNELLEYAEYAGNCYGTPKKPIFEHIEQGLDAILDIEVQGCRLVKAKMPESVTIFLVPPNEAVLERRLRERGTDSEEKIRERLKISIDELKESEKYDYVVVNDDVDRAAKETLKIIDSN